MQSLLLFGDAGLLLLRVILGCILIVHGWPKVKDIKTNAEHFEGMGFKPGMFWGTIVALLEFVGGICIIAGVFTQLFAFLIFIEFIVIVVKMKWSDGFKDGFEFDALIAAAAFLLATIGPGILSIDLLLIW